MADSRIDSMDMEIDPPAERLSTHIGFGTFMATTVGYWIPCRYNWSKQKFDMAQMQRALQQQAIFEGTDKERELEAKTEEA
uniref:Cytochrome c oxidase assembly protein COX20, mitochondrial n=1 Tax=Anopheles atroparvus TaxID=41427 RepID=A0A182JAI6_ANOAO